MLIGNKTDLEHRRVVSFQEAHDFARQFDMFYMETSAKNEQNVEEAFVTLAKEVKRRYFPRKKDEAKERRCCFCLGG